MNGSSDLRLLFVHDQEDYCNLFKEQVDLNSHLYKIDCQCTTSGHQALRMIREWRPSVVLLDAHIGDVNSFQVLDGCKGIEVAVIVTSDINSQEIEKSAEKHGACGYCHLLDDPESIEHMLKQIVNMVKAQPECFH